MNKIDIARGMVFQKLNVGKETFEERLICQKKVYLVQALGISLGFNYDWYIYGPYSKALTSYVFSNLDILNKTDFTKYRLTTKVIEILEKVNNLESVKPEKLTTADWYELLASLLYISEHRFFWNLPPNISQNVKEILLSSKQKFTMEQCEQAEKCLMQGGFNYKN